MLERIEYNVKRKRQIYIATAQIVNCQITCLDTSFQHKIIEITIELLIKTSISGKLTKNILIFGLKRKENYFKKQKCLVQLLNGKCCLFTSNLYVNHKNSIHTTFGKFTIALDCLLIERWNSSNSDVIHSFRLIYRSYAIRRIRDAFRENKGLAQPEAVNKQYQFANENLNIIRRQVRF